MLLPVTHIHYAGCGQRTSDTVIVRLLQGSCCFKVWYSQRALLFVGKAFTALPLYIFLLSLHGSLHFYEWIIFHNFFALYSFSFVFSFFKEKFYFTNFPLIQMRFSFSFFNDVALFSFFFFLLYYWLILVQVLRHFEPNFRSTQNIATNHGLRSATARGAKRKVLSKNSACNIKRTVCKCQMAKNLGQIS